ncbi:MAG TPA: hypothetical protein DCZ10_16070 [Pelotomaculum sp.]|nr:hypothetical protein [Pelotomaculum sp.]
MITVKELIEKLRKFPDEAAVMVVYLAETDGKLKEGDGDAVHISFVSDGSYVDGHKEPTLHISLFEEEAWEEIDLMENGMERRRKHGMRAVK